MARATSQMVSIRAAFPALARSRRSARHAPRPLDNISPAGPSVQPRRWLGSLACFGANLVRFVILFRIRIPSVPVCSAVIGGLAALSSSVNKSASSSCVRISKARRRGLAKYGCEMKIVIKYQLTSLA